jgi:large subunit ribosomal protein L7/L12
VILVDAGASPIELMREVRELTGLGLAQVHRLVSYVPSVIDTLPEDAATALKQRLETAGARVELERKR